MTKEGTLKRLSLVALAAALLVGLFAPSAPASANVQDFTIPSFKADYYLSKDDEGRSRLKVREEIVAEFPNFDQNHGLERAIPKKYDNHPTSLKITSVKKQDGSAWNYSTYDDSNDNLVVRIGDADRYVHGTQTFIITYEQRDVTRYFDDTMSDELYWDTNGTDWRVPIGILSATFHLDEGVAKALSGKTACYIGASGSTEQCEMTRQNNDFTVVAKGLSPGENVTVALGFQPKTFAGYAASFFEKILGFLVAAWITLNALGVVAIVWLSIRLSRLSSRKAELGMIVPEYLPPNDASVTVSASIISGTTTTFAAQLIDFAVRHYIKIYEIDKKWVFGSKDYELEIIKDISSLKSEEREILSDIFSSKTAVGTRLKMSSLKNNTSVYMSTLDNDKKLEELVRGDYGLRAKNEQHSRWFKRVGWVLLGVGIVTLSPAFLVASLVAIIGGYMLWPLTDKGLELQRYLKGLEMYIKVAEEERLKMLQSPEGAQKTQGTDPNDPKQLVHLYERVLPYAILFGQEKQWNAQLGKYYESLKTQPEWYSSNTAFSAAAFGSAMSSFSSASTYTSASSSSSGGSSGGGSSGGGGGGGGGGGW
jgi:uncharacterized membrane protein YgcG